MEAVKEIMDEQNANVERTNDQVRQVIGQVDDSIAAIGRIAQQSKKLNCLLYTSDAADEL